MTMSEGHIVQWLQEESDGEQNVTQSSEDEDDFVINSDHESNSEQSEGEEVTTFHVGPTYVGKDNVTLWNRHAPSQQRRRSVRNIVLHLPGVKGPARDAKSILEAWKLFFPDVVIEDITHHTNIRLRKIRQNYQRESDVLDTNAEEIKALLGLLYMAGVLRSSHLNVSDLWTTDGTAPEIFRMVMSYKRFYLLLRALRFDDEATRQNRRALDKIAPIRNIFDGFVERCLQNYSVSEYVTLDEMLESFRGRCSFRQYMPKKPAKYGLKMFALVDAKMMYTCNLEIYCGNQPEGPFSLDNRPHAVVKRLTAPIHGSGRNVTMDNWFASVPIVNELVLQHNLTVVATLKKNKRELPPETVNTRQRPINSSLFAFGEQSMVVSYVPKKYRNVILISSMHDSDDIDESTGDLMKPIVITFYNSTKGGVDLVDKMKGEYTVARVSFRWPLRIFFSLLDIGAINAQIILNGNTGESFTRRNLLKTLAFELMKPHMVLRATGSGSGLQSDLRLKIRKQLGMQTETPRPNPVQNNERAKCGFCPKKKNRLTKVRCGSCVMPICGEHTTYLCVQCNTRNSNNENNSESD